MATTVTKIIDPDNGSGTDYTSLSAWEAGQQGDLTGVRDEIAVAKCRCTGGTADTTRTTIDGWTTSATQYIKIWTDPAESYRHAGKWSTAKYRIAVSYDCITVNENYFRLDGIQFSVTTERHINTQASGTSEFQISNCIFKGLTGYPHKFFDNSFADLTGKLWNCLLYDFAGNQAAIRFSAGTWYIENCTIDGTLTDLLVGVRCSGATMHCKNVLVLGCQFGFYKDSGTLNCNYCATDDDTADDQAGTGNRIGQTFTFVDISNDDYHLASSDAGAKGYGTSSVSCGYSNDIDGETRSDPWDIGADEVITVGGIPPWMLSRTRATQHIIVR